MEYHPLTTRGILFFGLEPRMAFLPGIVPGLKYDALGKITEEGVALVEAFFVEKYNKAIDAFAAVQDRVVARAENEARIQAEAKRRVLAEEAGTATWPPADLEPRIQAAMAAYRSK